MSSKLKQKVFLFFGKNARKVSNCHKTSKVYFLQSYHSIGDNDLENQGIQSKPVHSLFCDDS